MRLDPARIGWRDTADAAWVSPALILIDISQISGSSLAAKQRRIRSIGTMPSPDLRTLFGASLAAATGALAGWWWQNATRESALEERTRARLRRWDLR